MTYAATNVVYENPDDLGSYELRSLICAAAVQVCAAVLGSHLRAIVLTGSLARNEATFAASRSGFTFLSDADFLLVLDEGQKDPNCAELRKSRTACGNQTSGGNRNLRARRVRYCVSRLFS